MQIRPQAAVTARDLFVDRPEREVEPGTVWGVDSAEVGKMGCSICPETLVYFNRDTIGCIDLRAGKRAWEQKTDQRPGTVMATPGMTVIAFEDGRVTGIDMHGKPRWEFKARDRVWTFSPGTGDQASMNLQTSDLQHRPFHMGFSPSTGEILWRSAGANLEAGIPFATEHYLIKSSNSLVCVDPRTGDLTAKLPFHGYGRELSPLRDGSAGFLDGQSVRKVKLEEGKLEPQWQTDFDRELTGLKAGPNVLYLSAKDQVSGLDPATGRELWSQSLIGQNSSFDTTVLDDGALLMPCGTSLTCVEPDGSVRFRRMFDSGNTISRLRVTDRGLFALRDPRDGPYRLELIDPQTGKTQIYAEIARDTHSQWLDVDGRVVKIHQDRVEMLELPELSSLPDLPAEPPEEGTRVVAETHGSVIVGGVRVKKKA